MSVPQTHRGTFVFSWGGLTNRLRQLGQKLGPEWLTSWMTSASQCGQWQRKARSNTTANSKTEFREEKQEKATDLAAIYNIAYWRNWP